MVKVNEAFEIRYKKAGEEVQTLVDFDELQKYREKPEETSIDDVVVDRKIYIDQKKGEIAPESTLEKIFNTQDEDTILKEILINGECQIPTAYLNKLRENKKEQIINYIAENSVNPQTKTKYTYTMIENAFSDIKYQIDPFKSPITQAEEVLKKLKTKLPISMDTTVIIAKIPGTYCGKFYGKFRNFGKIKKEFYDEQGNLHLHIEISESLIDTVTSYIKENTNGEGEYYTSNN